MKEKSDYPLTQHDTGIYVPVFYKYSAPIIQLLLKAPSLDP